MTKAATNRQRLVSVCKLRRRQHGSVLLLMIFLLVIASAFLLVSKLNKAATRAYREQATFDALKHAKQALIGYAASYPDQYPGQAPGQLPCPDTDNNGTPDPPCGTLVQQYRIGRFPWIELDTEDLRDGSGERLWYAVSGNHRNNPKTPTLNSELPGLLNVDGEGDIVAVVFAPGSSFDLQSRPSNAVADYLEGDNSNADANFVSRAAGIFNDRLVVITRQEIMAVVEKRILGELDQSLVAYRAANGSFPWLAPFQQPDIANYGGVAGTSKGQLPVHTTGTAFPAPFRATWSIPTGGSINSSGALPPADACVRDSDCVDPTYGTITGPIIGSTCVWTNVAGIQQRSILDCSASLDLGGVTRTYQFAYRSAAVSWNPTNCTGSNIACRTVPTATQTRAREFHLDDPFPSQTAAITVTDVSNATGMVLGQSVLNIDGSSTGSLDVVGIPYNFDSNTYVSAPIGPELPAWITEQNWHHLVYIAYPDNTVESPPGGTVGSCIAGTNCVVLNGSGAPNDNKRAIVLTAGGALAGQTRPSGQLAAYFEGDNATTPPDRFFERQSPLNAALNDQVRVVATSP